MHHDNYSEANVITRVLNSRKGTRHVVTQPCQKSLVLGRTIIDKPEYFFLARTTFLLPGDSVRTVLGGNRSKEILVTGIIMSIRNDFSESKL